MSKGAALLLACIFFFTFPLWVGLAVGGFGLVVGLLGAIIGVMAALVGTVFAIIGSLFSGEWPGIGLVFPHWHFNGFITAAILIAIVMAITRRQPGPKAGKGK